MTRTRKRAYTGSKQFDRTCRNHGGCPWCEGNRLCAQHRADEAAREQIDDFFNPSDADEAD